MVIEIQFQFQRPWVKIHENDSSKILSKTLFKKEEKRMKETFQ